MIFFPLSTDAPIYHWPWGTLALIIVNGVAFALTGGGYPGNEEQFQPWMLEFGTGLHPWQWLSNNFQHFGITHLILNMIFLWGFGLVVEGKLGWWKYLLVYLGIGVVGGLIVQLMMLGHEGPGSGGASLAIFGLVTISLVWAPKNDVTVFLLLLYRAFVFDVSILSFSGWFIAYQFILALFQGFQMSSELLHLIGGLLGAGVGVALLNLRWVDCENWDLFAVMAGTYGTSDEFEPFYLRNSKSTVARVRQRSTRRRTAKKGRDGDEGVLTTPVNKTQTLQRIRGLLKNGKPHAALAEYRRLEHVAADLQLEGPDLVALIKVVYKARLFPEVVPFMEEYIQRFSSEADRVRVQLAGIYTNIQSRPRAALKILQQIPPKALPDNLDEHRWKVIERANAMIEEGVIELDGRAWS